MGEILKNLILLVVLFLVLMVVVYFGDQAILGKQVAIKHLSSHASEKSNKRRHEQRSDQSELKENDNSIAKVSLDAGSAERPGNGGVPASSTDESKKQTTTSMPVGKDGDIIEVRITKSNTNEAVVAKSSLDNLGLPRESSASNEIQVVKGGMEQWKYGYTTDGLGRRKTVLEGLENRDKFLLFFGDSWVFGTGVNDNQTLPYYVGELADEYMVYNYGLEKSGPHHTLEILRSGQLKSEIRERNGLAVFTYIDGRRGSVAAAVGSMKQIADLYDSPYFYINDSDELVRDGTFGTGRALLSWVYLLLSRVNFIRMIDEEFDLPRMSEKHSTLTCRIVVEARNAFESLYPDSKFYVFIHPLAFEHDAHKIIPCFEKFAVRTIRLSEDEKLIGRLQKGPYGAPTPESNAILGKAFIDRFQQVVRSEKD
ncbi:MAG: hypothetical protein HYV97_18380 [Bdellovibrio sp.]|nr:hypothetical protein [Bdellovibrio sp.]